MRKNSIYLRRVVVPSPKIAINLTRTSANLYTVKENHVSSAVNKTLWYKETHTYPVTFI